MTLAKAAPDRGYIARMRPLCEQVQRTQDLTPEALPIVQEFLQFVTVLDTHFSPSRDTRSGLLQAVAVRNLVLASALQCLAVAMSGYLDTACIKAVPSRRISRLSYISLIPVHSNRLQGYQSSVVLLCSLILTVTES
jgi:hypothetical protein